MKTYAQPNIIGVARKSRVMLGSLFVILSLQRVYRNYDQKQKETARRLDHMRCGPFRYACNGVGFALEKHYSSWQCLAQKARGMVDFQR